MIASIVLATPCSQCGIDGNVCPYCASMDGTEVELGDAFDMTDGLKTSWNDYGRIPNAHPNCRCYFDEVIK